MAKQLKLGVGFGYWQAQPPKDFVAVAQEAERLGFESCWTAEAWGSDAFTPLAPGSPRTPRGSSLGTAVVQLSARTPTASTAMHTLTLDHLSKGRVIPGPGRLRSRRSSRAGTGSLSAKPLSRTREYVDIVRQVLRREAPVSERRSSTIPLPYTGEGAWGMGKPLQVPSPTPCAPTCRSYLGAEGPKNVALAAEICDGWLPLYYSPYRPRSTPTRWRREARLRDRTAERSTS